MISAIKKEIDVLGGKVPAPTKNLILSKMGFAPAWENSVKLI